MAGEGPSPEALKAKTLLDHDGTNGVGIYAGFVEIVKFAVPDYETAKEIAEGINDHSALLTKVERLSQGQLDYEEDVIEARAQVRDLRAENERLSMKVEQYQIQLEDKWAAHLEQLESVREAGRKTSALARELVEVVEALRAADPHCAQLKRYDATQSEGASRSEERCPWCTDGPECGDRSSESFGMGCTRERGHEGPHVACGNSPSAPFLPEQHDYQRWVGAPPDGSAGDPDAEV